MTAIASIRIGERVRKDMGDLAGLAASIQAQGLLQPIGINEGGVLVFGERRLRAYRDILGLTDIEARVVNVTSLIEGERDENEMRKEFSVSERVAIAQEVEREIGRRQGARTELRKPVSEVADGPAPAERTADFAARKAGFGNRVTFKQAEAVIRAAAPDLVAAVDRGDVPVKRAFKALDKPAETQRALAKAPRAEQARMLRGMRYDPKAAPWHDRVQTVAMAIEALADAPLTAEEFRAHALPYTLGTTRAAIPKVLSLLTAIEETQHDETRSRSAA